MKQLILDGNKFSDLKSLYDVAETIFTKNLDWQIGRNLDAFNDVLRGGFGVHQYGEPIKLIWLNSAKSEADFGYKATLKYLEGKLKTCHPTGVRYVRDEIQQLKNQKGPTLFETLVDIIKAHEHIELELK